MSPRAHKSVAAFRTAAQEIRALRATERITVVSFGWARKLLKRCRFDRASLPAAPSVRQFSSETHGQQTHAPRHAFFHVVFFTPQIFQ
jgi:hypothetical protein